MNKYSGKQGGFALQLAEFAEQAMGAVDASLREVVVEIGNSLVLISPVGNQELWAVNVAHYDFKVSVRNTVINLTDSNFTKVGKLKRGVTYAKPLTKTERDQNFNVNGLVAGKDYVGGRFRGNWMFNIGTPDETTTEDIDPSGSKSSARIRDGVIEFRAGDTCYITNSLPYAIPLEFGHSTQAPGGMVRVTVARFQQIVLEAIRNNQV
jgi:hypothetical protein